MVDGVDASRRLRASMRMRFAGESNVVPEKEEVLGADMEEVPRVMDSSREWNLRLVVARASGGREEVVVVIVVVSAVFGVFGATCADGLDPGLGVLGEAWTTSAMSIVCDQCYLCITFKTVACDVLLTGRRMFPSNREDVINPTKTSSNPWPNYCSSS